MNISIDNISKYRSEIMGFAILGVMLAHIKTICVFPDTIWNKILGVFCYSVCTGGFIFLSGLGLYSSMSKNDGVKQFYIRRIKRLLIPFWIISTPYFLFTDIYQSHNFVAFLGHVSTLDFWAHGNYSGMWYISMTVMFYLIYPLIHKVIYIKQSNLLVRYCALILSIGAIIYSLKFFCPHNYEVIAVGVDKLFLFALGSFTMWAITTLNQRKERITSTMLLGGGYNINIQCINYGWFLGGYKCNIYFYNS